MKISIIESKFADVTAPARSGLLDAVSGVLGALRKAASDRALHRQLADMDDALLRDIGLGDDEIYRVRQGSRLTPRNWR